VLSLFLCGHLPLPKRLKQFRFAVPDYFNEHSTILGTESVEDSQYLGCRGVKITSSLKITESRPAQMSRT
jgi:hypothetical protein